MGLPTWHRPKARSFKKSKFGLPTHLSQSSYQHVCLLSTRAMQDEDISVRRDIYAALEECFEGVVR